MSTKPKPNHKCLACKKRPRSAGNRGCCHACYRAAYRAVKAGKTTWAELLAAGLIRQYVPRQSPFSAAFARSAGKPLRGKQ